MFATSILLPCAAKKSRKIRPRTADFFPPRADKQPTFASAPTGGKSREAPLTARASGYENFALGFVGWGNAWRAGIVRRQKIFSAGKHATCRHLETSSPTTM